jgi:hypothetical protein
MLDLIQSNSFLRLILFHAFFNHQIRRINLLKIYFFRDAAIHYCNFTRAASSKQRPFIHKRSWRKHWIKSKLVNQESSTFCSIFCRTPCYGQDCKSCKSTGIPRSSRGLRFWKLSNLEYQNWHFRLSLAKKRAVFPRYS